MALDTATALDLIKKLQADRDAYLASVNKTHELLIQAIEASSNAPKPKIKNENLRRATTSSIEVESIQNSGRNTQGGSSYVDDTDSDDSDSLFVSEPLESEVYDLEGLRNHIKNYPWPQASRAILQDILENREILNNPKLFPTVSGPVEDRSHLSHYSMFDVGPDGAPLEILSASDSSQDTSRALAIWNRVRSTNANSRRERQASGRITIVREPSPLLFAALHYTNHKHFDVDEMFQFLVDDDPALVHPHRAFAADHRHRRTFVFVMQYFTIIGEGCKPMRWQLAEKNARHTESHIPISRCCSVVGLSLSGQPINKVRNKDRRLSRKMGDVYDPFAPWRVLSIQCYPDWRSSVDSHDSTKHYVNGPEAFLVTLRAEFRDARKRLLEVNKMVSDLVEPPNDFMFNEEVREKLLFEDDNFTYSRRYFWAYQTLAIMNQDIDDMLTSYREAFKDHVWDGSNKIIWPGEDTVSSRHSQWRKRMANLRKDLDFEIDRLFEISRLNDEKIKDIKGLRDNLFSGTSVLESRRSVQQSLITVKQGQNIKLLTLVTIFFLPLTFVTSVFGMTNIPTGDNFSHFAYTTIAICIPTYILIGSLNTDIGVKWWESGAKAVWKGLAITINALLVTLRVKSDSTRTDQQEASEDAKTEAVIRPRKRRSASSDSNMISRGTFNDIPVISPRERPKDYTSTIDAVRGNPIREIRERSPTSIKLPVRRDDFEAGPMTTPPPTKINPRQEDKEKNTPRPTQSPISFERPTRKSTLEKLDETSEEGSDDRKDRRVSLGSGLARLLKRRNNKNIEGEEKDIC